jgi:CRP-like cAMP-binding protein
MFLKQADLFWGLDQNFIKTVTAFAVRQEFEKDAVVFQFGDPASHFFILVHGKVHCTLPGGGQCVHACQCLGEVFGWATLIGLETYGATAVCAQPTDVLSIEFARLQRLLDEDAHSATAFYRQLSRTLGERLLESYQMLQTKAP